MSSSYEFVSLTLIREPDLCWFDENFDFCIKRKSNNLKCKKKDQLTQKVTVIKARFFKAY